MRYTWVTLKIFVPIKEYINETKNFTLTIRIEQLQPILDAIVCFCTVSFLNEEKREKFKHLDRARVGDEFALISGVFF